MISGQFDIKSLYQAVFGHLPGGGYSETPIEATIEQSVPYFSGLAAADDESGEFVTVRRSLNANTFDGRPLFMPVKIGGLLLPNEPTILITAQKNIVETALAGSARRGTVKELISVEDYQITIRGIALTEEMEKKLQYPEDMVKKINDLFNNPVSLEIECALTNLLGIYRVVIKSVAFPEMVGVQHAQAYELQCVSDEDFDLEL